MQRSKENLSLIFLFALSIQLTGCVRNPITGKREFHMISEKAEQRLGQESKDQIVKEYGLYQNPVVQAYVNEVGQKIVAVSERKKMAYEFVILDTPLVNAFAVPGFVFVTRGILELIDDEAELASVIGHEIGHVTGYHSVKMIQKAFGYQFLSTFATIAVAVYGPRTDDPRAYGVLYQATNLVAAGFLNGYGREFELEADRTGLRYAVLSGYEPEAMISFFKRMSSLGEEKATGIGVFLRTHPPTDERIKQVKKQLSLGEDDSKKKRKKERHFESDKKMASILKSSASALQDHFERYQEIVRNIPKQETMELGIIRDGIYEHPALGVRLEVPKGWKLEHSYGKSLVSFFSPDGKAQGELQTKKVETETVISADQPASVAGISASTVSLTSRQWAENIEPGMKMEKRTGRDVVYPAGSTYVGTYKGRDKIGRPAHFKILFIVRGDKPQNQQGFVLTCAAPDDTYLDYLVDFEKILKSFNWLSTTPK